MHRRIADSEKTKLLPREFLHCFEGHAELIFANHILTRLRLNGEDISLVRSLQLRPKPLIDALASRLKPVDPVCRHLTCSVAPRYVLFNQPAYIPNFFSVLL